MSFKRPYFSRRAHLTELMDEPSTYEEFRACLRNLEKVRHDGPVSILRSFSRADWEGYSAPAGLSGRGGQIRSGGGRGCAGRV
jgi:hypothetical protein